MIKWVKEILFLILQISLLYTVRTLKQNLTDWKQFYVDSTGVVDWTNVGNSLVIHVVGQLVLCDCFYQKVQTSLTLIWKNVENVEKMAGNSEQPIEF